jgi:integrase
MQRITERFVSSIIPSRDRIYWDDRLKGFGVRVSPSGRKTYLIQYRNLNRGTRRFKLGVHGKLKAEKARSRAKELLGKNEGGFDPSKERNTRRYAPTLADLARDYFEHHGPKKRASSLRNDHSMVNRYVLPHLGRKPVADVTRRDVQNLHQFMKGTPHQANRALALLSKMFSLAIQWDWRLDNPARGIERYPEAPRERWLSQEELGRLFDALAAHPNQRIADAVRLLILTGARRSEVLNASWDQFDLENGAWTKPSHHTKQKRIHRIPLSAPALKILADLRVATPDSEFLFPGRSPGQPLQDIKKFWRAVTNAAQLEDLRLHDLRHTYASHLVSSGHSLLLVGRLLGHTQPQTTFRYAHFANNPLQEATDHFAATCLTSAPLGQSEVFS